MQDIILLPSLALLNKLLGENPLMPLFSPSPSFEAIMALVGDAGIGMGLAEEEDEEEEAAAGGVMLADPAEVT